jgi:hypothetical protein
MTPTSSRQNAESPSRFTSARKPSLFNSNDALRNGPRARQHREWQPQSHLLSYSLCGLFSSVSRETWPTEGPTRPENLAAAPPRIGQGPNRDELLDGVRRRGRLATELLSGGLVVLERRAGRGALARPLPDRERERFAVQSADRARGALGAASGGVRRRGEASYGVGRSVGGS